MAERVVVIGVGPDGRLARDVPTDATLVVGGRRHLAAHAPPGRTTCRIPGDLTAVLDEVAAAEGTVAVLASGDPGWFGIVRRLAATFGPERLEVAPAVSAVAATFARAGLPWDDAVVVSAHGRDPRPAVAAALAHPRVAVMTSPDVTPASLAHALRACGSPARRVVVATRLGHHDGTWHDTDLAGALDLEVADPNVVLLVDGDAPIAERATVAHHRAASPWARPVADFTHRDGQITKPPVRAAALAHLAPTTGRLLWDVGCGSGSVAVEAAGLGAGVIAIDRDADQVARTRANATAADVSLGTRVGDAPEVLVGLPDPDAVFVGGGGDALDAILDVVAARCRHRIAVALATLERVAPTVARLRAAGLEVAAQQLQAHDLVPLAGGHRLAPHNPVVLVLAEQPR